MIQFETDERVDFQADAFGFDTVLYLRRDCGEPRSEIACDDDGGEERGSRLALELPAGQYTLILDAFSEDVDDAYTLELQFGGDMPDAGMPDAGVDAGDDDAGVADTGAEAGLPDAGADLGVDGGEPLMDDGCSCSVGSRQSPSWLCLFLVAGSGPSPFAPPLTFWARIRTRQRITILLSYMRVHATLIEEAFVCVLISGAEWAWDSTHRGRTQSRTMNSPSPMGVEV